MQRVLRKSDFSVGGGWVQGLERQTNYEMMLIFDLFCARSSVHFSPLPVASIEIMRPPVEIICKRPDAAKRALACLGVCGLPSSRKEQRKDGARPDNYAPSLTGLRMDGWLLLPHAEARANKLCAYGAATCGGANCLQLAVRGPNGLTAKT